MSRWSETFEHTEHQPYPLPARPWIMHMSWQDLLFAHWPIPAEVVHLPYVNARMTCTVERDAVDDATASARITYASERPHRGGPLRSCNTCRTST
jgi:uncharacterized protein YqjF (DUF2071 family)